MIFQLLFISLVYADKKIDIESGIRLESNSYYSNRNSREDVVVFLKPSLFLSSGSRRNTFSAGAEIDYAKHTFNEDLDNISFRIYSMANLNHGQKYSLQPRLSYQFLSEPPDFRNNDLIESSIINSSLELKIQSKANISHYLKPKGYLVDFKKENMSYLNHINTGFGYKYEYYFLPETAFLVLVDLESNQYKEGLKNLNADPGSTRYKYDSLLYQAMFGFSGRLTEFTRFHFNFGYAVRQYKLDGNFSEPVFNVGFEEQITPKDTIIAGYDYKVEDSLYTNYELVQQIYLGYSRVLGDRLIVFFRGDYIYKSYSLKNRREDQRLYGTLRGEYSYKRDWLIQAGLSGDFLVSDALNQTSSSVQDPASSYQAISLYVSTKYLF